MQRYTEKIKFRDGSCAYRAASPVFSTEDIIKKLCEYEDLEEQGRLIILPCKPGDTVFAISGREEKHCRKRVYVEFIVEGVVDNFVIGDLGIPQAWVDLGGEWTLYDCKSDFGKSIFLTKEAAEAALKESEQE